MSVTAIASEPLWGDLSTGPPPLPLAVVEPHGPVGQNLRSVPVVPAIVIADFPCEALVSNELDSEHDPDDADDERMLSRRREEVEDE